MRAERLYAPGPVPVPQRVLAALAEPVPHHRGPAFREVLGRVRANLAEVFRTPGDDVVIVTGSGTAAFEGAVLACVPQGSEVLCLRSGRFGEKWVEMCRRFGFRVTEMTARYGTDYDLAELEEALRRMPGVAAVVVVHSETSTGMLHDLPAISRTVRGAASGALVIVDAVSSLGAAELRPRDWDLDAVVTCSQKGLMTPPGLSFAWLSERAWRSEDGLVPSGYLNLRRDRERQRDNQTSSTPAVSLIAGLDVALEMILEQGVEERWREKARLNDALLAAGEAVGLSRFAQRPSPALAALATPEGLDASQLVKHLREDGIYVGSGQGDLKERILRPSLLGHADDHDLMVLATALEGAAVRAGMEVERGSASSAAAASLGSAA